MILRHSMGIGYPASASPVKRLALDTDIRPDQPDVPAKFHFLLSIYNEPSRTIELTYMFCCKCSYIIFVFQVFGTPGHNDQLKQTKGEIRDEDKIDQEEEH